VIFTNREPKTTAFNKIGADISYGDSDGDIRDSMQAGARPIPVLRARTSVNHDPAHNGRLEKRFSQTRSSTEALYRVHTSLFLRTPRRILICATGSYHGHAAAQE
jgi:hypothetical protein